MKTIFLLLAFFFMSVGGLATPTAAPAPDFSGISISGKKIKLSDYRGKTVVLEWSRKECPFVKKHYDSRNMQNLQKEYAAKGVIWLTVLSASYQESDFAKVAAEAEAERARRGASPTETILDGKQAIASLYSAKTTPHLFVVSPTGILTYQGAIDDTPSADKDDVRYARNYLRPALDATIAGKPVPIPQTEAYGCSIKYSMPPAGNSRAGAK